MTMMELRAQMVQSFMNTGDADWEWPSSVPRERWKRVEFESYGAELVGVFGEAQGDPSATIVLAHPNRGDAKGYFLQSKIVGELRERGYDVFAFDLNGFGESEQGDPLFHADVISAVEMAEELSEASTNAVLGVSLGGACLVTALAECDSSPIDAAVFDSVYPTLKPFLWPQQPFAYALLRVGQALRSPGARELSPVRYAASVTDPEELLFIYGEDDSYVTSSEVERMLSAFPHGEERVQTWGVPEVRHNSALKRHPEQYVDTVTEYIERSVTASS